MRHSHKIKNYIIFSIPLLFRVIGKGHAISLAMHFYKLNFGVKRTSYKTIKASKYDVWFLGGRRWRQLPAPSCCAFSSIFPCKRRRSELL